MNARVLAAELRRAVVPDPEPRLGSGHTIDHHQAPCFLKPDLRSELKSRHTRHGAKVLVEGRRTHPRDRREVFHGEGLSVMPPDVVHGAPDPS